MASVEQTITQWKDKKAEEYDALIPNIEAHRLFPDPFFPKAFINDKNRSFHNETFGDYNTHIFGLVHETLAVLERDLAGKKYERELKFVNRAAAYAVTGLYTNNLVTFYAYVHKKIVSPKKSSDIEFIMSVYDPANPTDGYYLIACLPSGTNLSDQRDLMRHWLLFEPYTNNIGTSLKHYFDVLPNLRFKSEALSPSFFENNLNQKFQEACAAFRREFERQLNQDILPFEGRTLINGDKHLVIKDRPYSFNYVINPAEAVRGLCGIYNWLLCQKEENTGTCGVDETNRIFSNLRQLFKHLVLKHHASESTFGIVSEKGSFAIMQPEPLVFLLPQEDEDVKIKAETTESGKRDSKTKPTDKPASLKEYLIALCKYLRVTGDHPFFILLQIFTSYQHSLCDDLSLMPHVLKSVEGFYNMAKISVQDRDEREYIQQEALACIVALIHKIKKLSGSEVEANSFIEQHLGDHILGKCKTLMQVQKVLDPTEQEDEDEEEEQKMGAEISALNAQILLWAFSSDFKQDESIRQNKGGANQTVSPSEQNQNEFEDPVDADDLVGSASTSPSAAVSSETPNSMTPLVRVTINSSTGSSSEMTASTASSSTASIPKDPDKSCNDNEDDESEFVFVDANIPSSLPTVSESGSAGARKKSKPS